MDSGFKDREKIIGEINRLYDEAHALRVKKVFYLFSRRYEKSAKERFDLLQRAFRLLKGIPKEEWTALKTANRINFDLANCYLKGIGTEVSEEKAHEHIQYIQKEKPKSLRKTIKEILEFLSPTFPAVALVTLLQFFADFRLKYTDIFKDPLKVQICMLMLMGLLYCFLYCLIRGIVGKPNHKFLRGFNIFAYGFLIGLFCSILFQWAWPPLYKLIKNLN